MSQFVWPSQSINELCCFTVQDKLSNEHVMNGMTCDKKTENTHKSSYTHRHMGVRCGRIYKYTMLGWAKKDETHVQTNIHRNRCYHTQLNAWWFISCLPESNGNTDYAFIMRSRQIMQHSKNAILQQSIKEMCVCELFFKWCLNDFGGVIMITSAKYFKDYLLIKNYCIFFFLFDHFLGAIKSMFYVWFLVNRAIILSIYAQG